MWRAGWWALAALLLGSAPRDAHAGGGPENVFLVVNATSWASLSVANHFVALRHLPAANVLCLPWEGGFESIEVETFRQQILLPALAAIERRKLAGQIDYLVYSADFPYMIAVNADLGDKQPPPQLSPAASLNGATYLWQFVGSKSPAVLNLDNNQYMRAGPGRTVAEPSLGFRGTQQWGPQGERVETGGVRYLLSTVLAETSGRGTSVREAVDYLTASAAADGTHPTGTIYFAQTDDIRTKVRQGGFAGASERLKELGVAAQIEPAPLPLHRPDVQGAMLGVAEYNWASSGSTIRPGAICDNLTSFGGIVREDFGHTTFAEPLRHGAAGASGPVNEPYAIGHKFPVPEMHVHYARGCTLAEAFYQSVFGPYQLLIVGDPLCRPWARIPQVELAAPRAGDTVSGVVELAPTAANPGGRPVAHFELFVDGRRAARQAPGQSLRFDTTALVDGWHELRIVAIEEGPIASQGRAIVPIVVDNRGHFLARSAPARAPYGRLLPVEASAAGAAGIALLHDNRLLAKIDGAQGAAQVDTRLLGLGPVTLHLLALDGEGKSLASGEPLIVEVDSPVPLVGVDVGRARLVRGMHLTLADGKLVPVQETREPANWLAQAGVQPGEHYALEGYFDVDGEDVYQFQLWHYGQLTLRVDDRALYDESSGKFTPQFVPVALAKGLHRMQLAGVAGGEARLRLLFGGSGTRSASGATFKHLE